MRVTVSMDFTLCQCANCDVRHYIPTSLYESLENKGGFYHCPNGHQWGWTEGREAREKNDIRRERDLLKQRIAQKDDEIRAAIIQRDQATEKAKKLAKRASAGTCPCCNRTVSQMARHMKSKHPEFKPDNVVQFKAESS